RPLTSYCGRRPLSALKFRRCFRGASREKSAVAARLPWLALGAAFFALAEPSHAVPPSKALEIYFVDVEGGQATLFVTPAGQSLLIDTGWPDNAGRDANRIAAVAKKAGLSTNEFLVLTHY